MREKEVNESSIFIHKWIGVWGLSPHKREQTVRLFTKKEFFLKIIEKKKERGFLSFFN